MKQILFYVLTCMAFSFSSKAQSDVEFGLKGGLNLTFFQVVEGNFGPSTEVDVGGYAGVFTEFHIDETFSLQPEVLYITLGDFDFLNAPIYAKYEVANNLYILVGPSLNYFFDFFSNKFKVRADISSSYNISKRIDIHVKYTLGFEEFAPNGLFLGLGYKL